MKYIHPPSTPAAGDVLWTSETDGEYRLVRVLSVVKRGTICAWVQLLAPTLIDRQPEPVMVRLTSLQVQVGADGAPTRPTRITESPDRPDTHIAYPSGIEAARFGGSGTDAVLARPAIMDADSQRWELHAPTCPFAHVEGPRMLCAWGGRLGEAFRMEGSCPHSAGVRKADGAPVRLFVGCQKA